MGCIFGVGGASGTGKTTVAERLAVTFRVPFVSTGHFARQIAKEHNVSLAQLEVAALLDRSIDDEIDGMGFDFCSRNSSGAVLDGRQAIYNVPDHAVKILIKCGLRQRISQIRRRMIERQKLSGRFPRVEWLQVLWATKRREWLMYWRFRRSKQHRYLDPKLYDVVVDATGKTADEVFNEVLVWIEDCPKFKLSLAHVS